MSSQIGQTPPIFNPTAYVKDAITILVFLGSIAGVYVKTNAQVVVLEQKVASLESSVKELKESNQKVLDKVETLRGVLSLGR